MRSLEGRQWFANKLSLAAAGVGGNLVPIPIDPTKQFYITTLIFNLSTSAAAGLVVENTGASTTYLDIFASTPAGMYGFQNLFRGIAVPVGQGVQVTAVAGNAGTFIIEGYWDK